MDESDQSPSDQNGSSFQAPGAGETSVKAMSDHVNVRRLKRFVEEQKTKQGERPEVSPEHKKTFTSLYARLFKYAREKGQPERVLMGTSEGGNDYITAASSADGEKDALMPDLGDAHGATLFLERGTAYERQSHVDLFGEEAVHATDGELGWLNDLKPEFMRENGIERDLYTFYSDGNILLEQFADPDHHESQGEYPVESKWLAAQEIEALGNKVDFGS